MLLIRWLFAFSFVFGWFFFVFAAVAVSDVPTLRRDFVQFLYVIAPAKDVVDSLLKPSKQRFLLLPSNRLPEKSGDFYIR